MAASTEPLQPTDYTDKPTVRTRQVNPSRYEIEVLNAKGKDLVLAFSKPFNKGWGLKANNTSLNVESTGVVNGDINGWKLKNTQDGVYTIEFKPQESFNIGVKISLATLALLIVYLIAERVVIASTPKSKSQG